MCDIAFSNWDVQSQNGDFLGPDVSHVLVQAQTVVADNLGLAVAVCISNISHGYPRLVLSVLLTSRLVNVVLSLLSVVDAFERGMILMEVNMGV